jgi:hypothetical protein
MLLLKQSTAVVLNFGPFVDKTDGVTPETGLVSALDHASTGIMLSKNGGALTIRHATVTATTYDAYGNYRVTLDTTDTNTIGTLRMQFIETATCLPVWVDLHVLAANVYDSLFGAATDKLDVNVEEWNATAVPAEHTAGYPIATIKDGAGTGEINTNAGKVVGVELVDVLTTYTGNTVQTGDNFARLGAPAGASVSADIAAVKVDTAATLADTGTDGVVVAAASKSGYALSAAGVQAIWDALTSALTTVGSIGKKLADWTIHSAADVWAAATRTLTAATNITSTGGTTVPQTGDSFARLGAPAGASVSADVAAVKAQTAAIEVDTGTDIPASLTTIDDFLDTEIAAIKAKTDLLPEAPAKNTAFTYVIKMVLASDHVTPATGLTVTMTRSIDGAAFGAATGTVTEISTGHYKIAASAADMNGDVVAHRFAAVTADDFTQVIQTTA